MRAPWIQRLCLIRRNFPHIQHNLKNVCKHGENWLQIREMFKTIRSLKGKAKKKKKDFFKSPNSLINEKRQ